MHGSKPEDLPRRGRGRPKKPTHKTPADVAEFDAVAAAIKAIPPDKPGAPGRNAAREAARALAGRDARLSRSAIVLFNQLLDAIRWDDGRCRYSLQWFANACGMLRRTISLAFLALADAGYTIRRRRIMAAPGDWDPAETTVPALAKVWAEMSAGGGVEKIQGVVSNKTHCPLNTP